MHHAVERTPERRASDVKIDRENVTVLWNTMSALTTLKPRGGCRARLRRFDAIEACILEAGAPITAREAERRDLILENPGLRGHSKITTSLDAGVQLVMPSEVAPAHATRSRPSASSRRAEAPTRP